MGNRSQPSIVMFMEVSNDKDFSSPQSGHSSALPLDEMENRNVGEAFWNLPNTITMLRVLVIPAILVFPFYINDFTSQIAGWLFVFAGVTDVVDGWLARRGQQVTKIGKLNIIPSFTPGIYGEGDGKDLGHIVEFKSEVQLSLDIFSSSELGFSYNHISNASLGDKNPGANSYMFNFLKKF